MAYCTISNWTATDWNDDTEKLARDKYVPMVMSLGAKRVQMIRTADRAFSVVTEYADEAAATKARNRIAEIRKKAADEMPMKMSSDSAGTVFASN